MKNYKNISEKQLEKGGNEPLIFRPTIKNIKPTVSEPNINKSKNTGNKNISTPLMVHVGNGDFSSLKHKISDSSSSKGLLEIYRILSIKRLVFNKRRVFNKHPH